MHHDDETEERCTVCKSRDHVTYQCSHESIEWRYNIIGYVYANDNTANTEENYDIFAKRVYSVLSPELIRIYGMRYGDVLYSSSLDDHVRGFWNHYMSKKPTPSVVEESATIEEMTPATPVTLKPFMCGICFVTKKPYSAARLQCKHLFCKRCVVQQKITAKHNACCGICRGPLPEYV